MFEKQRLRVLKNLSEALKEKGYQAGVKKMSQAEIEKILEEVLSFLYASDEEQAWKMLYMSEQAKNFINSSIDIAGDFGLPMVFETDSPFITELMSERAQRFAKKISDTTYNQLKQSLLEGFLAGESESKLAERVNDVMTLAKRQRAQTIARTETFSVVNQAHIETYRMNGVEWKEWLTAGDERVRDMHVAADGQITKLDDYFNVGGEYLMYPGDPNGSPENIINCRCVSLPVIS
jgi:SPP1 gp7 family putative phage head morphogenesis protein